MMAPQNLGQSFKTLRAFRLARQLSQREAGELFHVTQVEWSRYERGLRRPRAKLAQKIAKVTGVPLETLLGI
jgi:transcriptional regulator with XRE-family HTH domain